MTLQTVWRYGDMYMQITFDDMDSSDFPLSLSEDDFEDMEEIDDD